MKAAERKQRHDEAMRSVETAMDRLRRAARKNEKAAALHTQKQQPIESLAPLLEPEADENPFGLTDSGLHELP
jgi:hypothetical protein